MNEKKRLTAESMTLTVLAAFFTPISAFHASASSLVAVFSFREHSIFGLPTLPLGLERLFLWHYAFVMEVGETYGVASLSAGLRNPDLEWYQTCGIIDGIPERDSLERELPALTENLANAK